jgi:hypothetical protein
MFRHLKRGEGAGGEEVLAHGGVEVLQGLEVLLLPIREEWQPPSSVAPLDARLRDFKISADLPRKEVVDLAVAGTEELFRAGRLT